MFTQAVWILTGSLGPIPVLIFFRDSRVQTGKHRRQQFANGNTAAPSLCVLAEYLGHHFSFVAAGVVGQLLDSLTHQSLGP